LGKAYTYLRMFSMFFFLSLSIVSGQAPDPTKVYVQSVTYGGTGCPSGSVGTSISNDRQSLTLIFDSFVASTGPGVPVTESRKNCQLNVNLRYPSGFQYSITTFDYRGFVQLPVGAVAEQKATYYFQGEFKQGNSGTKFTGPVSKDYLVRDTVPTVSVVWSSCSRVVPMNVNAQVRIFAPSGTSAQITTDSVDAKVTTILGISWRECD